MSKSDWFGDNLLFAIKFLIVTLVILIAFNWGKLMHQNSPVLPSNPLHTITPTQNMADSTYSKPPLTPITSNTDFMYEVGQDVWVVSPGYGRGVYRGFIRSRIVRETSSKKEVSYTVELNDTGGVPPEFKENEVFDMTRTHNAMCAVIKFLRYKK